MLAGPFLCIRSLLSRRTPASRADRLVSLPDDVVVASPVLEREAEEGDRAVDPFVPAAFREVAREIRKVELFHHRTAVRLDFERDEEVPVITLDAEATIDSCRDFKLAFHRHLAVVALCRHVVGFPEIPGNLQNGIARNHDSGHSREDCRHVFVRGSVRR